MIDSQEVKLGVLKELMEKMRELEGGKMRPKAVEVDVSSMKPEGEEETGPTGMLEHRDGMAPEHGEPNGDELSPEDAAMLEEILGGGGGGGDDDDDDQDRQGA